MKALIQMGYSGKLTGVERSKLLFQMLQCTYSGRIDLFNEDLSEFIPMYKFEFDFMDVVWNYRFFGYGANCFIKKIVLFFEEKRAACY